MGWRLVMGLVTFVGFVCLIYDLLTIKNAKIKPRFIKGFMFTEFTDIVPSFFGWLNQGPMTLTLFYTEL